MNPAMDPGIAGMRNLLQVAYLHTNIPAGDNFPPRRRRLAAASRKAAASLPLAPVRVDPFTLLPVPHPFTHSLPNPRCQSRAGPQRAVRSGPDGSAGVYGRLTAVEVCDGSFNGGKTAASEESPPGTAVVGRETGRRHLGTVPSGDGPS